jgi:aminopeptidase N
LVVIADSLYKEDTTFREVVVAHEVAHQWWYSLVGNDQIDEPWLDEAFAQFTTALYYRDRYGEVAMQSYVEQLLTASYDRVKGTDQDQRADLPVGDYTEDQYSPIVYGKAALFFNALYEALGDAKFNQFMQEYFQTYRYGIAYPTNLFAIAAKYVGQAKLDELVKTWITGP